MAWWSGVFGAVGFMLGLPSLVGCSSTSTPPGALSYSSSSSASCTAANCAGCCLGAKCETGNTAAACGTGGAACASCGSSEVCVAGACGAPSAGAACTQDGVLVCGASNAVLLCKNKVLVKAGSCPSLQTCQAYEDQVECGGTYFAVAGAACANNSEQACAFDLTTVEVCAHGTWVDGIHCPPSTCATLPKSTSGQCSGTWCSNCGYSVGDICDFQAGSVVCSTDEAAVLECSNGRTVVYQQCTGSEKCSEFTDNSIGCQ